MAILRAKEVARMDEKTRAQRLKELQMELIKANVAANKTNAKTKEIKRAIARLKTVPKKKEEKGKITSPKQGEVNKK